MISFFKKNLPSILLLGFCIICFKFTFSQNIVNIAEGWSKNSVNTVIFRKNALTTYKNYQFASFYNENGFVVIAKRKISSKDWQIVQTPFKGNMTDAHCSISIAIDGDGYIHLSWGHHNNKLRYVRSLAPLTLDFGKEESMTGKNENRVTYPEFYRLSNGNLLFLYRDGGSGNGSLVINKYNLLQKKWEQLHSNLIDGEGKRNAYWQACVDSKGYIHISWTWRESPDVASNHDICYARSKDGGITWERSNSVKYKLPINAGSAEYAVNIQQNSELINQTSMTVNAKDEVLIASYWREQNSDIPQYHVVIKNKVGWQVQNLGFRKTAFSLSGTGTKRIPISRPQIIAWNKGNTCYAGVIFRDEERNGFLSMAINKNTTNNKWSVIDILKESCGSYEPLYDFDLWLFKKKLHLFVQKNDQVDGEGKSSSKPEMTKVVEWTTQY